MMIERSAPSTEGRRIVICDYNALLLSVTGLLRMSGYAVFQADDGWAAQELCIHLPDIEMLVLNTYGSGINVAELCRNVRTSKRDLPILHIGSTTPDGLPDDVPSLSEDFSADSLLLTVGALLEPGLMRAGGSHALRAEQVPRKYPNGRRREDSGSRPAAPTAALYNSAGVRIGGIGVSGDSSCADHNIAWKARDQLGLDFVPAGVADGGTTDNIIYDIGGDGVSVSGFGHPECSILATQIGQQLPTTHPLSGPPAT
jgi:CheY-like chemotaxis protein